MEKGRFIIKDAKVRICFVPEENSMRDFGNKCIYAASLPMNYTYFSHN
jgi:hypothetical protein